MSVLDDLKNKLVADGVGVFGTNIFISSKANIPTGNGPYLTLNETGGVAPTRVMNYPTPNTQRPTVQVLVRASTEQAARTMAWAAYQALDGIFNATLGTTFYLKVTARQEITDMGLDATSRIQLVFNLDIEKVPS